MTQTLQQRHQAYEAAYDCSIINRLPVIIKLNGRSFSKITKSLQKPFDHQLTALLNDTMLSLAKQIDGVWK
jgi:tRNA(His) guanylyltransferase